jgi:hypothetical protein
LTTNWPNGRDNYARYANSIVNFGKADKAVGAQRALGIDKEDES